MRTFTSGLFLAALALGTACSTDSPTAPVTTPSTPAAPTITGITAGAGQLSVAFTAGADGGSAITNHEYSTDGGTNWTARAPAATTSPILITGLTNGTTYEVRIRAVNSQGAGAQSNQISATPATTPATTPAAPEITGITADDGQLSVAFTAGGDGGSAITNYEYSTNNGTDWTTRDPVSTASPMLITGLTNGTTYEVRIRAVSAVGSGAASNMETGAPGSSTGSVLTLGTARIVAGAGGDSETYFTVVVPSGAPALRVTLSGGTGDADLAIRFGARPDHTGFDCGSFGPASNEECIVPSPTAGTWHILVLGSSAYSGVQLLAEVTAAPTVTALTSGVALTNLSGAESSLQFFSITVPAGATNLTVTTAGGTGNVDLFLRFNALPSPGVNDCLSDDIGNDEICSVSSPAAGTWYMMLNGWEAYAGVTLTATVTVP